MRRMIDAGERTGERLEEVLIQGRLAGVGRDERVDLLCRQAQKGGIREHAPRRSHPLLNQDEVHGMVAGDVPALSHPMRAPREMRERAMQRLVREHELRLGEGQPCDVVRIKVERPGIGRDRGAMARARRGERQMHDQRPNEGTLQDEPGAGRGELGVDLLPHTARPRRRGSATQRSAITS